MASCRGTLRGRRTRACAESPCARTGRSHARPAGRSPGGPLREGQGHTPEMHEYESSDMPVVPAKPPNNAASAVAEAVEERGMAKGNTDGPTRPGLSAGHGVTNGLDRVREVDRKSTRLNSSHLGISYA